MPSLKTFQYAYSSQYFWLISISIFGLLLRLVGFDHDIDGNHMFRQAHVASNIEYLIANGLLTHPDAYEQHFSIRYFDYPLYQQLSYLLHQVTSIPAVQSGRIINLICYVALNIYTWLLLKEVDTPKKIIEYTLGFYALSGLAAFYNRAIVPDNLATVLSFASLYYFVRWRASNTWQNYCLTLLTAVLCLIIKVPVYLPIVITILTWFLLVEPLSKLFHPKIIVLGFCIVGSILGFTYFSSMINFGTFEGTHGFQWYFGTLDQRLNIDSYVSLFKRLNKSILSQVSFIFSVIGIYSFYRQSPTSNKKQTALITGLLFGALITVFTFFNVNLIHNYYQIPYISIFCFFAAYGFHNKVLPLLSSLWKTKQKSKKAFATFICIISITEICIRSVKIKKKEQVNTANIGVFIEQNTSKKDFVLYTKRKMNGSDPMYLYFAKREGVNLSEGKLKSLSKHASLVKSRYKPYQRYIIFIEEGITPPENIQPFAQSKLGGLYDPYR